MSESRQPLFHPQDPGLSDGSILSAPSAGIVAVVGLLLAVSFLIGCDERDTTELSQKQKAAIADTISSLVKIGPRPNPEPYLQLYGAEAPFYAQGSRLSRSEHEALVHEEVSVPADVDIQPSEPEVDVLGPRAAVASIRLRGHVTDTTGNRRKVSAAITQVYKLRDGEWRVVQAHESFAPGKSF